METNDLLIQNRYRLGRLIGCGGMSYVYAGTDIVTGETVAIKQLRADLGANLPNMVERFAREGEALRKLNHPNIVKVLATAEEDSATGGKDHYLVMEYVSGGSLADLLAREPKLPLERIVSMALELSDALSRAHHLHILHRDFKPGNILLAGDGTPRLTDFGLAHMGQLPSLTEAGTILGTLNYMSPEALQNRQLNQRSDIWSFGVVLYEMITGRLPFSGDTPFDVAWAIKNQALPVFENLRGGIPPSLAGLVRRMLRKDNPARVESARQLGAELEIIQKELAAGAHPAEPQSAAASETAALAPIIRVLIADDHAVVRQGLRMFIDLQEDLQVVGEGANGQEAVDLAAQLQPDVVLLDLVMPLMDGIEATRRIKKVCPSAKIIILTSFGEDHQVLPAIQAGALGYLLKDIHPEQLVQSVRDANRGKTQLHPDIAQKLMEMLRKQLPGE